jgi:hypothetical protein
MRFGILPALLVCLAPSVMAQRSSAGPALEVTNYRGVVSGSKGPSGSPYPASGTYPISYGMIGGVIPGTRTWTYTPEQRTQLGHVPGKFITVTGMTQGINLGGSVTQFPSPAHYQFATGIGPVATTTQPHGKEHAPSGPDIVYFPAGAIAPIQSGIARHSFTLTTPVSVPRSDLVLFVEFKGGEYYFDPLNGQTNSSDWQGGNGETGGRYSGFAEGMPPRTISYYTLSLYRAQIGMLIEEPLFTATGFHANQYTTPPMPNEDYVGLAAAWADWRVANPNASLFFHFSAGPKFANGSATVLANLSRSGFAAQVPTPFGNLFLSPTDPLLTLFPDAGLALTLDPSGHYLGGPMASIQIPTLGANAAGLVMKMQGVVFDPLTRTVQLTNASSITIR